jgi:hypothetical protein
LKILNAEGLPQAFAGREVDIAFQAPGYLRLSAKWEGQDFIVGRDQQELWIDEPAKKFALLGSPDVAPFAAAPEQKSPSRLGSIKLPVAPELLAMLPLMMRVEALMGGHGQGNWDGKPMAELVREVMEKANTLAEAVAIMRRGPRTCEYYYVISDGKSNRAVGIAATPNTFDVIEPGMCLPELPFGIPDTVLMSSGDRYQELARRVKAGYGKFDAQSARDLMKPPVCMNSNIQCALFEPETLDFWVANADSENPAANTRYTHYNLGELIQPEKAP